jgi:hypothetical protein
MVQRHYASSGFLHSVSLQITDAKVQRRYASSGFLHCQFANHRCQWVWTSHRSQYWKPVNSHWEKLATDELRTIGEMD